MTDRELLEFAAKTAGIKHKGWTDIQGLKIPQPLEKYPDAFTCWNPLTDDGDALRLAVNLNMHLHIDFDRPERMDVRAYTDGSDVGERADDHYAATRRAIVRAAAEIGKGMK